MKVIGLFTGWACRDWVNLAIKNHLKIVDEMHVMIAPHNAEFEKLDDGTLSIAVDAWKNDKRVVFHKPEIRITACCDKTKCALLNQMLWSAKAKPDDIVMLCDSDEFYDDAAVREIKEKFDGYKWDSLLFYARYFVINMQWYLMQDGLQRVFRVRAMGDWRKDEFHFKPTQRPIPRAVERRVLLKDNPMFHYSLLSPIKYKLIHWTTENGADPTKKIWLQDIYAKYDPMNHNLCRELVSKNPTRGGGFYVNNDMGCPKEPPYLYRYSGKHPEEIENGQFTQKKDFR